MIEDGQPSPGFDLPTDKAAGRVRLAALKGRPAVLFFYPKDDTSGCTAEAKDFTSLKAEFDRIGVPVIGISPDSAQSHAKFRAKHGLAVELASDEGHRVADAFGVWVEKSMYGRKYMGIERSTFLIDGKGRIARQWRKVKVKVKGHAAEVLAAAEALGR